MTTTIPRRADALDALRGLAILLMVLSGSIHFANPLPAWMYHAQVPPPEFKFNPDLPGITWVDLVFPFFLFAMGAAFPFALSKRLDAGVSHWRVAAQSAVRGLLLVAFAIVLQHTKPFLFSSAPGVWDWLITLLSFAAMFVTLVRFPDSVAKQWRIVLRSAGVLVLIGILSQLRYQDGSGFALQRSDIIIIVLANTAFFGSVLWMLTRNAVLLRLGVLGILMALRLTQNIEGSWNQWLWNATPFPWMYKLYYLQYLFIVIPGTVLGDLMHRWYTAAAEQEEKMEGISRNAFLWLAVLCTAVVVTVVAGLFARQVLLTLAVAGMMVGAGWVLLRPSVTSYERLLRELFSWGIFWLVLGFFFEAYEGGIKKDRATVSYYFITSGLAVFTIVLFSILADRFTQSRKMQLLIDNGKNPMIAYVAGNMVVLPVLSLTMLMPLLNELTFTPRLGFVKGVIVTLLVALITQYFTIKKLFWRT